MAKLSSSIQNLFARGRADRIYNGDLSLICEFKRSKKEMSILVSDNAEKTGYLTSEIPIKAIPDEVKKFNYGKKTNHLSEVNQVVTILKELFQELITDEYHEGKSTFILTQLFETINFNTAITEEFEHFFKYLPEFDVNYTETFLMDLKMATDYTRRTPPDISEIAIDLGESLKGALAKAGNKIFSGRVAQEMLRDMMNKKDVKRVLGVKEGLEDLTTIKSIINSKFLTVENYDVVDDLVTKSDMTALNRLLGFDVKQAINNASIDSIADGVAIQTMEIILKAIINKNLTILCVGKRRQSVRDEIDLAMQKLVDLIQAYLERNYTNFIQKGLSAYMDSGKWLLKCVSLQTINKRLMAEFQMPRFLFGNTFPYKWVDVNAKRFYKDGSVSKECQSLLGPRLTRGLLENDDDDDCDEQYLGHSSRKLESVPFITDD